MTNYPGVSLQPESILDSALESFKAAAVRELDGQASDVERRQLAGNPADWRRALVSLKTDLQVQFQKHRTKSFTIGTGAARIEYEKWKTAAAERIRKLDEKIREVKEKLMIAQGAKPDLAVVMLNVLDEVRAIRELLEKSVNEREESA